MRKGPDRRAPECGLAVRLGGSGLATHAERMRTVCRSSSVTVGVAASCGPARHSVAPVRDAAFACAESIATHGGCCLIFKIPLVTCPWPPTASGGLHRALIHVWALMEKHEENDAITQPLHHGSEYGDVWIRASTAHMCRMMGRPGPSRNRLRFLRDR